MMYVLSLIGMSFALCASEEQERQTKILKALQVLQLYALKTINLPENSLNNAELKTLLSMTPNPEHIDVSGNVISTLGSDMRSHASLKSLDLSNNSFSGEFPLQQCLGLFPNLETLKINGNHVTALLELGQRYTNSSLKTYEARATSCAQVDLSTLYNNLCLETLDLSDSKQLVAFSGLNDLCRKNTGIALLRVLLNNTIIPVDDMTQYAKQACVNTQRADSIIGTMAFCGGVLGAATEFACVFIEPYYCGWYVGEKFLAGVIVTESFMLGVGIGAGYLLGKAIVYKCLNNYGKQPAITFVREENIDL